LRGTVFLRYRALEAAVLPGPPTSAHTGCAEATSNEWDAGYDSSVPQSLPPVTPLLHKQQGSGNFQLRPRRSLLAIADEVNAAPGSFALLLCCCVLRGLCLFS
jgi:hypothetical protein